MKENHALVNIRSIDYREIVTQQIASLALSPGQIDVWEISLDEPPQQDPWSIVSQEAQARANRFRFERDRSRFLVAGAALRVALGLYLNLEAERVEFDYGENGKPRLLNPNHHQKIRFNMSHSGEFGIIAVCDSQEIGVDIEKIREIPDFQEICESFFSSHEIQTIRSLPPEEKQKAFFRCWTSKEAYLKGLGCGLSHPLDSFDVQVDPKKAPVLLGVRDDPAEAGRWILLEAPASPGYISTLAVLGSQSNALREPNDEVNDE